MRRNLGKKCESPGKGVSAKALKGHAKTAFNKKKT